MPQQSSKPQHTSIFQEQPKYEISKSFQNDQLNFKVSFNVSTINFDYEAYDKKFNKSTIDGVSFDVVNDKKLVISVKHRKGFEAQNDKAFRSAIGVASRHNIYSSEVEDILKHYQRHLEENNFHPPKPQHKVFG